MSVTIENRISRFSIHICDILQSKLVDCDTARRFSLLELVPNLGRFVHAQRWLAKGSDYIMVQMKPNVGLDEYFPRNSKHGMFSMLTC